MAREIRAYSVGAPKGGKYIVGASSMAEVARILKRDVGNGYGVGYLKDYGNWTGHALDEAVAIAHPGTTLYTPDRYATGEDGLYVSIAEPIGPRGSRPKYRVRLMAVVEEDN